MREEKDKMNLFKRTRNVQQLSCRDDGRSILEVLFSEPKSVGTSYILMDACCAGLKDFEKSIKSMIRK